MKLRIGTGGTCVLVGLPYAYSDPDGDQRWFGWGSYALLEVTWWVLGRSDKGERIFK